MRLVSWNVNGLRAALNKGFMEVFATFDADVFALQEIKLQAGQVELELEGYHQIWSYAEKKGYSGTAVFSKEEPLRMLHELGIPSNIGSGFNTSPGSGININPGSGISANPGSGINTSTGSALSTLDASVLDREGRLCAVEFKDFWFVCCYTPNAQDGLARIDLRLAWGAAFREFVSGLASEKPVVICGDLNVAHNEIDLKNPGPNRGNAGFSDEEREDFSALLEAGFTDSFRYLYPDLPGAYSWWSFRGNARANNTGWRIDYFLVSDNLAPQIESATIWPEVYGSDHCPVSLEINFH
ncbi:MAG: exodeoxyribonuclease III [Coriobacteriia bacterium]|nr:exodeoxyribonuclease III [Coriobacteriia bacterium]